MSMRQNMRSALKKWVKGTKALYPIAMVLMRRKPIVSEVKREIRGNRNTLTYPATAILSDCRIDVRGDNNSIHIGEYCVMRNITVVIRGNNNKIHLGMGVKFNLGGSLHMEDDDGLIRIDDHSTFEDVHIAATERGSQITIGEDCMFAYDIDVRSGDSHSIVDTRTNQRINFARNVNIGNHVWVAAHCSILKGVQIGDNCIVATRSVVTRSYEGDGLILGGCPARVLKENVTWDRQRIAASGPGVAEEMIENNTSIQN